MRTIARSHMAALAAALVVAGCAGPAATKPAASLPAGPATAGTAPASTAAPASASAVVSNPGTTSPPSLPDEQAIPPGTYTLDATLAVTIDVPAGWEACCRSVVLKDQFTGLLYADVSQAIVYDDPCAWSSGTSSEPRGAQAIASALSAQKGRSGTRPRTVTIAGRPGVHVRLTVPADQRLTGADEDPVFTGCDQGDYRSFTTADGSTRYHQGQSQIDDFYLVDVGANTVVFDIVSSPAITPTEMDELGAMLASVRIG